MSLWEEYEGIVNRFEKGWKKGPTNYRNVLAVEALGELPALLEKLRKMPVPKESGCKRVQKVFEKGIDTTITHKS